MHGLKLDFDVNDIVLKGNGSFATTVIDNQNAALIALSQVCRITKPEVGAQIGSRLQNRRAASVAALLAEARRMIERDGGRDVSVILDGAQLSFLTRYDN